MSSAESKVAPTLEARLACACNCAYGISVDDGHYTAPAIYDAGVGWLQPPTPVSAPLAKTPKGPRINACLVGANGDGIVVAARGTLPFAWTVASIEDWWQDIVDSAPIAVPQLTGKVHEGFWDALQSLWPGIVAELQELRATYPKAPIYVTGHSKGGPLASIGAALMVNTEGLAVEQVVTFASPHPGDQTFVAAYPSAVPVTRFENYLDIVPFVPPTDTFYEVLEKLIPPARRQRICEELPSLCKALQQAATWDYAALGTLQYVTKAGAVVPADDPAANPYLRLGEILFTLFGLSSEATLAEAILLSRQPALSDSGVARIGAAHCIACACDQPAQLCAGGYMTGAGGDPICVAGGGAE